MLLHFPFIRHDLSLALTVRVSCNKFTPLVIINLLVSRVYDNVYSWNDLNEKLRICWINELDKRAQTLKFTRKLLYNRWTEAGGFFANKKKTPRKFFPSLSHQSVRQHCIVRAHVITAARRFPLPTCSERLPFLFVPLTLSHRVSFSHPPYSLLIPSIHSRDIHIARYSRRWQRANTRVRVYEKGRAICWRFRIEKALGILVILYCVLFCSSYDSC